ncbi:hypothetical protein GCM10028862_12450 [Luteimonas pelagia]
MLGAFIAAILFGAWNWFRGAFEGPAVRAGHAVNPRYAGPAAVADGVRSAAHEAVPRKRAASPM